MPNTSLKKIKKLLSASEAWEREIKEGLTGKAKAKLEKDYGIYEVASISYEKIKEIKVLVKLQNSEENQGSEIFFDKYIAEFRFTRLKDEIFATIHMLYSRRGLSLINKVKDILTADIGSIMQDAIKRALHKVYNRICNPEAYAERRKLAENIIVSQIATDSLAKQYSYGVSGEIEILHSSNNLYRILSNPNSYPHLHNRFIIDNDSLRFGLLSRHFILNLKRNSKFQTVQLVSNRMFLAASAINISFKIDEIDENRSKVVMSIMYGLFFGTGETLSPTVNQLAEKLIKTSLRHLSELPLSQLTSENDLDLVESEDIEKDSEIDEGQIDSTRCTLS